MKLCTIAGCDHAHYAKGLCNKHYLAARYAAGYRPPNYGLVKNPVQNRLRATTWRLNNLDRVKASQHARYIATIDVAKARMRKWRIANIDQEKENKRSAEYRKAHPEQRKATVAKSATKHADRVAATLAKRRAAKLKATPAWANDFFISEAYHLARLRTKVMGFKWHVDHIVPLRHKLVCGLHVEHNLQVIPMIANISKSNRRWPDMP